MLSIALLGLAVPMAVYLGLIVCHSALLTFILFHGLICLGIPSSDLLIRQRKTVAASLEYLGWKNFRPTFLPALAIGLLLFALTYFLFIFFQDRLLDTEHLQVVLESWHIEKRHIIPFMFMMIVANSVIEEIYWRGYLYRKLERIVSPGRVVLLSSAFYTSYHIITTMSLFPLQYAIIFTIIIFSAGIFWAIMRRKYDSIFYPLISHLLADLGIMLIYLRFFGR